jgi:hypothetical protein
MYFKPYPAQIFIFNSSEKGFLSHLYEPLPD